MTEEEIRRDEREQVAKRIRIQANLEERTFYNDLVHGELPMGIARWRAVQIATLKDVAKELEQP